MNPFKTHGAFSWFELMTTDPDAASKYYSTVFGWTFQSMEMEPNGTYHVAFKDDMSLGGLMKRPSDEIPVNWGNYVTVDDVDATAAQVKELGGHVVMEPMHVQGVGKMAACVDPMGAFFSLMTYDESDNPDHNERVSEKSFLTPGAFSWCELRVADARAAEDFYRQLFGWNVDWQQMPNGLYGVIMLGDVGIGGMVSIPDPNVPPHWGCYVTVANYKEHVARVIATGGTMVREAMTIPGVGRFAISSDPQGGHLTGIEYEPMPQG